MDAKELLERVKLNLIIDFNEDDDLILTFIKSATAYAEGYQHLEGGYYKDHECSENTRQAIVMLSSHFYESRDGSTGGFYADNTNAAEQIWKSVNRLLLLDRNWSM